MSKTKTGQTSAAEANAAAGRTTGRPWFSFTVAFIFRYADHPCATIGAFARLACCCAGRLSGGVLAGSSRWTSRQWLVNAHVDREEVDDVVARGLARWDGENLRLSDYDAHFESEYIARRARAAGARKNRWPKPEAGDAAALTSRSDVGIRDQALKSDSEVRADQYQHQDQNQNRDLPDSPSENPGAAPRTVRPRSIAGGADAIEAGDRVGLKARHVERFTKHGAYPAEALACLVVVFVSPDRSEARIRIESSGESLGIVPTKWLAKLAASREAA